ncbi:MAG: FAD-dependent oxidoreductase [Cyanobacteria bacterium Co-bin8]|nr:FAD-dependent oxidoreductase [Cyanobacteria bacterium Co-bin8]
MARSHLTHRLAQAYRLAAQVGTSGQSPQETLADSPAAAAQRLPNLPATATAHPKPLASGDAPVLVVGAGLAGLVVAYRLRQAGIRADVIEGRDRIGGRILSLQNVLGTGLTAEMGGEVFDSVHTCCLGLAAELGLPMVDAYELLPADAEPTYFFERQWVELDDLISHLLPLIPKLQPDLDAVQQFLQTDIATERVQALDQLSICEYLTTLEASPLLQSIVRVAYTIKYGVDAEEQSCLNLLAFIQPRLGEFNLFGSSDERYFLKGGNGQLPQRLATVVADYIETGTVLEALRQQPDGRYRVSLRSGLGTCDRTYERVVITIPFNLLRHIPLGVDLPPRQRQAIDTLGSNSPTKLITAYRQKRWLTQYRNNGLILTDLPMQNAWESSGSLLSAETGLLTNYTGGHHSQQMSRTELAVQTGSVVSDLDQIFPGLIEDYHSAGAVRSEWLSDNFSQGAYSCYRVGQWTTLHGSEGGRVGNLFFAGEHCSRNHQGYMEGACETGEAVALELLSDLRSLKDQS